MLPETAGMHRHPLRSKRTIGWCSARHELTRSQGFISTLHTRLTDRIVMAAPETLVSAVVVNWNGAGHLEICLPSLLAQSYRSLEIIVVDNASTDGSVEVAKRFGVRWLPLDSNLGLAAALNRGAQAAAGEFVLFLNNDMRFQEAFVDSMVKTMAPDPDIFSVDALQYDWSGTKAVHLATRLTPTRRAADLCYAMLPGLYVFQESCRNPTDALMSSAANMLVRRSMFQTLGGFDERLPLGYEDIELCWRAWLLGWKTIFDPTAVCWHRVGASTQSTGRASRMSFRGVLCGQLLTATKLLPASYAVNTFLVALTGLAADVARLRWERIVDRINVLTEFLQHLFPLIRERRELYGRAQISPPNQLRRLFRIARV
jgi:GT2 family glycosyltransferase